MSNFYDDDFKRGDFHMENIQSLKEKIQKLEKENAFLKELLDNAGIKYNKQTIEDPLDPNQGARILQHNITASDANLFFSMFWGRTDVFSKRTVNKSSGKVNYYTQCYNFWKYNCPRRTGSKIRCRDCNLQSYKKLELEHIITHLKGYDPDGNDVIGIYPLLSDNTCRFIVFDFDDHVEDELNSDLSNENELWKNEVDALREICTLNGIDPLIERSRSGKGAHIWIFFQKPVNVSLARKFGNALLYKGSESVNLKSFRYYDRMLPMQDYLPEGHIGNLIALPLQGQALKKGNSAFIDENWNAYPDQWAILLAKPKLTNEFIETKVKEWTSNTSINHIDLNQLTLENSEKPWDKMRFFIKDDVAGILHIILSDGIYIDTTNLKPRLQNRIRELAAFKNPEFYKNQAIGLSTFKKARYIYLGKDENNYIKIPRGLLDNIISQCNAADIEYQIDDKRYCEKHIKVSFNGQLKDSQIPAVTALTRYDNGILNAATAFGKTVVCCNIIAKKKLNTLILLQNSALMDQWENALNNFLIIDEPLPEYTTPSGRKKQRKNIIGKLQGSHNSLNGIIDIAMVGSIHNKTDCRNRLKEYGLVILDECHHAASDTIADILQETNAKYVYGVTATPLRSDGLEKINYMLLGPIRFKYSSKERAKEQGIQHLVYPRFTRTVAPRFGTDKIHPNEAYSLLRNNVERDALIINDAIECIKNNRTPVILSKYIDHAKILYTNLKDKADHVFLLSGDITKKDQKKIIIEMNQIPKHESLILVATGSLIGEGFDFPRLDTLIMATPVAWKSIVEQYAGRLNRDYQGKDSIIVYDYVDSHIPIFDKMYHKRLKAYKQIGYDIYTGSISSIQETNAIFDCENYVEIYNKDLQNANKEIILSSPVLSSQKVDNLIESLKYKQENGVKIVIITWKPDMYHFGKFDYWMELHERMYKAGFEMNLVDDYCQRYCIIDQNIVWYGSLNFLGKEDSEDNLIRIKSQKIALELLELTFGNEKLYSGNQMGPLINEKDTKF